jgi:hypothetical protein
VRGLFVVSSQLLVDTAAGREKKQIPRGNDRKKSNGNSQYRGLSTSIERTKLWRDQVGFWRGVTIGVGCA